MKNNKIRVVFIVIIVILLVILLGYMFFNVFLKSNLDNKKQKHGNIEKKVEELVEINEDRCDNGYCVRTFKISRLEDDTFNFEFVFENTNDVDLNKGCFELYFSDIDNYVFCYDFVAAGGTVTNTIVFENDNYSNYDNYKIVELFGEELNKYYSAYSSDLSIDR